MKISTIFQVLALIAPFTQIQANAESHADETWKAQWIGAATLPKLDLADASWIWTDEAGINATRNAKPGTRFFRHDLDLTENTDLVSAVAAFSADNHFRLFVNGQFVGRGDVWNTPTTLDILPALRPGINKIVVEAINKGEVEKFNAAGLLGKIRVERKDLPAIELTTDATWQSSKKKDATHWNNAHALGKNGIAPWSVLAVNTTSQPNQWNCFRRTFTLAEKPKSAMARLAVDSKYWLWVNGKLVIYEGELKRGPTPNDTYYDRLDLAPYLQEGENTIAILAWYWGKDGYSHKSSGKAGLVFELNADATEIISDSSWKMLRHPAHGVTDAPHPNYRMPDANIHFDAQLDFAGTWTAPNFDDSHWPTAVTLGNPPAAPWNKLIERPIPQWRFGQLTAYENAKDLPRFSDGKPIIARLPRNLSISPYLKIKAPAGLTIDMRTDNYKGGSEYNFRSEYVTKEGVQEFESLAYLNGHWMIYSIPEGVEILDLRYRETRYDTDFTGTFKSNDPFLNKLWMKARNTMNLNMRDCIQDPDRERAQWWGDEVIVLGQIFYTCDSRAHALIKKGIHNLVDWQKPNDVLFSPIPTGHTDNELPMQMLASIGNYGFWTYYLHTGDQATIEHAYPAVKRYLSLYQLGADGLVIHRPGDWDWADWGENIDAPVIENAWVYQAMEAATRMARLTGNDADVPHYEKMRASISKNYNRVFWTGSEYRSPNYKDATDERGHGLAVLVGLATPEQWPAIKTVLAKEFHASPYMEKYVLESLFHMNDPHAALARMKSRYRKMVDSEYTTLWEGWGIGTEGFGGGSYNHGWAGGPLTLMMQYLVGVAPTSPAYETYRVNPQLGDIKSAQAGFDILKGRVEVNIIRDENSFNLKLTSPEKTSATVCIPVTELGLKTIQVQGKTLWREGKSIAQIEGITPVDDVEGRVCFTVAPGTWVFTSRN